jgi:hypothetical protein
MVLGRKLNLMANKNLYTTSIYLISLLMLGMVQCRYRLNESSDEKLGMNKTDIQNVLFSPDTTVNSVLCMNNPASFELFLQSTIDYPFIERERETPVLILSNKSHSEYLLLYQFEGSISNAFSKFEIVSAQEYIPSSRLIETNYSSFRTESDLELNMSLGQVIEKKGKDYIKEGESKIVYSLSEFDKSEFLRRYNMPEYLMELYFRNGHLYRMLYGFTFP